MSDVSAKSQILESYQGNKTQQLIDLVNSDMSLYEFIQFIHAYSQNPQQVHVVDNKTITPVIEEISNKQIEVLRNLFDYKFQNISDEKCPKCTSRTIQRTSKQTRSADEAATVFLKCLTCGTERRE